MIWRKSGAALGLCGVLLIAAQPARARRREKPADSRAQYVARLEQQHVSPLETHTVGSLWTDQAAMSDISRDYKALRLNDTVTIVVEVQTTAAQSGTVDSERSFSTSSAITGLLGKSPASTNPLLSANSSSALKGQGSTASNSTLVTSLTGQVIAVLPGGNLIVEAQRSILMNNQHEDILVRGMIRPGDIGPANTVPSTALSDLEIEMKGKGIISDGVRPPNLLTRILMKLVNF
jgi:flagellar L-ring protein precursor FlgH